MLKSHFFFSGFFFTGNKVTVGIEFIVIFFRISESIFVSILDLIVFGRYFKIRCLRILRCQAIIIHSHTVVGIQSILSILKFKQVERLVLIRLFCGTVINFIRMYMIIIKGSNITSLHTAVILRPYFIIHTSNELFLYTCNTVVHTIPKL